MYKFFCPTCKKTFAAKRKRKDWQDPIVGPCHKYTAACPACGNECNEYRPTPKAKKSADNLPIPPPTCGSGACGIQ